MGVKVTGLGLVGGAAHGRVQILLVRAQPVSYTHLLQVLAAQMQHQNGGSIGVAHQRSQQLAGLCMVCLLYTSGRKNGRNLFGGHDHL